MDNSSFLAEWAPTISHLELLVFFRDNPSTMDTSESLALWTAIPVPILEEILESWTAAGIVGKEGEIYYFIKENPFAHLIDEVSENYRSTRGAFRAELERLQKVRDAELMNQNVALMREMGKTDTLLSNISDGVIVTDESGMVYKCNSTFQLLFTKAKKAVLPCPLHELFSDTIEGNKLLHAWKKPEMEEQLKIEDKYIAFSVTPIRDATGEILLDENSKPVGFLWFFRDITQQVVLDEMKEELSRMITHDLRSPMTGIFTAFDLVLRHGKESIPDHLYRSCVLGRRTSQFILGMVNDLIDVHKIQDGSLPLERAPVYPNQAVEDALQQILPMAQDRNLHIVQHIEENLPPILADSQKLIRVMVNLLTNAVKYSPKSSTVTIELARKAAPEKPISGMEHVAFDNYLSFVVRDSGYGIPEESLPHIFDKYFRVAKNKQFNVSSTGLGLYFCRLIVEAHRGVIWAESEIDKGSTFYVVLPYEKHSANSGAHPDE